MQRTVLAEPIHVVARPWLLPVAFATLFALSQ